MSATASASAARHRARAAALPRLLDGIHSDRAVTLEEHVARYGPIGAVVARRGKGLVGLIEESGLRGRGGSNFPTVTKLRAVAGQRRRPVVVVNATEGEPVSGKDRVLLRHAPHLVLDGAVAVAAALGAREAIVAVSSDAAVERAALVHAIAARGRSTGDGRVSLRLATVPPGFVSGEESALVQSLNGGPARPTFKPPLPYERGVGGAPTLVQNAETLAHVALIARFGAQWFREAGTPAEPGSTLVTISGAVRRPGVIEVAFGTPLAALVERAGGYTEPVQAILIGGYFGTWVGADRARTLALADADLRRAGAALGAGSIVALPASACGVAETARIARYLADESAGQCGSCVHGLAAVAGAVERLARLERADERRRLAGWLGQVKGRGACRHPDGAARFVESALVVFADEVERHLRHGTCGKRAGTILPVPERRRS